MGERRPDGPGVPGPDNGQCPGSPVGVDQATVVAKFESQRYVSWENARDRWVPGETETDDASEPVRKVGTCISAKGRFGSRKGRGFPLFMPRPDRV